MAGKHGADRPIVPLDPAEFWFAMNAAGAAHSGRTPMDSEQVRGRPLDIEGFGVVRMNDTPMNRAMKAIRDCFPESADKRESGMWRGMFLVPLLRHHVFRKHFRTVDGVPEIDGILQEVTALTPFNFNDSQKGAPWMRARLMAAIREREAKHGKP